MKQNIRAIQVKLIELIEYFDNFCTEYGVTYYLMGGSALGAIRHSGFIPWDDDFDVFMTHDEYIKFLKIAERNLNKDKFYLQKENTFEWPLMYTKLRMNDTTYIENDTLGREMHKGFFIDIFSLNNTTKNRLFRYVQYVSAKLVISKTLYSRGYHTQIIGKKIALFLSNCFIRGFILSFLMYLIQSQNKYKRNYVGHFFGRAKFKYTSFPSRFLDKPKYVKFEDLTLPVPSKVDEYLIMRFGQHYMEIPNQKTKDLYPQHAMFVDTEKHYTYYE